MLEGIRHMTKGTSLRVPQTSEMKAVLPTTVPLGVRLQRAYKRHWQLYVMLIPALVLLALFSVYPLWGIGIAFVDYNPFKGVLGSE
jgi:putative aldouronate transport system permease protein